MFKKLFKNRNEALAKALNKYNELDRKNKELEHDLVLILDTNRDLRAKIVDLENNLELVINELTPAKRKKLGL